MTKEKQIEEMTKIVIGFCQTIKYGGSCEKCAKCDEYKMTEALYNAGYRKASDVAEDIIRILRAAGINKFRYPVIAEIEKKYLEGENEG